VVRDYLKRRVWKSVRSAGEDGEVHGLMRGIVNVGMNPSWKDDAFWTLFKKRMDLGVLDEFEDELSSKLVRYLRGEESTFEDDSPFVKAGLAFGEAAARHIYVNQGIRAWWDPEEVALAWNDFADLANRYALEVARDVSFAEWARVVEEEDAVMYSVISKALCKLCVFVGLVKMVRNMIDEAPPELVTFPLADIMAAPERRVYTQASTPFDMKPLEGIVCTHVF
jgi:hypothetical protein